jgi:hypothetical protein
VALNLVVAEFSPGDNIFGNDHEHFVDDWWQWAHELPTSSGLIPQNHPLFGDTKKPDEAAVGLPRIKNGNKLWYLGGTMEGFSAKSTFFREKVMIGQDTVILCAVANAALAQDAFPTILPNASPQTKKLLAGGIVLDPTTKATLTVQGPANTSPTITFRKHDLDLILPSRLTTITANAGFVGGGTQLPRPFSFNCHFHW